MARSYTGGRLGPSSCLAPGPGGDPYQDRPLFCLRRRAGLDGPVSPSLEEPSEFRSDHSREDQSFFSEVPTGSDQHPLGPNFEIPLHRASGYFFSGVTISIYLSIVNI